jgi:toxin-antitoxin system PIN domain toxin
VTLLDANILIYAYNADAPQHKAAAKWLERLLGGSDLVGLPWATVWAFLRVSTNSRIWPKPTVASKAIEIIQELLALPGVVIVQPGSRHLQLLGETVMRCGATGALVSDAVLAALAIENGATLASTDADFSRFENLQWVNPLR